MLKRISYNHPEKKHGFYTEDKGQTLNIFLYRNYARQKTIESYFLNVMREKKEQSRILYTEKIYLYFKGEIKTKVKNKIQPQWTGTTKYAKGRFQAERE